MRIFKLRVSRSPLNPDFEKHCAWLEKQEQSVQSEQKTSGYIPPPLKLDHLKGKKMFFGLRGEVLPSQYDLRKEGRLTPVKDQGMAGTCWAFATYGSLESCLLPAENWNFSENNMKNLLARDCPYGYDRSFDGGGNEWISSAYLTRWDGPVLAKDDPYNPSQGNCQKYSVKKHIRKIIYVPDRRSSLDNTNLKLAIKNYGAVFTGMYYNDGYYDNQNAAYYTSGGMYPNHAICLVGWDDNYSRSKFKSTPAGDGAFIGRNSWGKNWGEQGYFYISYYDIWIGSSNAVFFKVDTPKSGQIIHQYDQLGWVGGFGFRKTTAWFANIFTAQTDENLEGCSFYTASPDSSFSLYVYKDVQDAKPRSGQMVKNLNGTITEPSYFYKPFSTPIALKQGQKFSVVIKLNTPDWNYPISAAIPIQGYSSMARSEAGQGFISENGNTWYDIYDVEKNSSICLKAFGLENKKG